MSKSVLITGVSSGFGKAFAVEFKQQGWTVGGISRRKPEMDLDFHLTGDLTSSERRQQMVEEITSLLPDLSVVINNAGVGFYDTFEHMKESDLREVFEINFFAHVFFTQALLPLIKENKGSVVNVSSVAGKLHVPHMGGYCASKYALNAFSDTLRAELLGTEVNVMSLIVGRINTGFSSRAFGQETPPETPFAGDPVKFAKVVYRAVRKRKKQVIYPGWYRWVILLQRLLPGLYDKVSASKWKK